MDLKTLWENFDVIAEAENGIQRLREVILDLAARGLLVPQYASERKADSVLEIIESERNSLLDNKQLKKDKKLPEVDSNEIPYKVPSNWYWTRLGEVVLFSVAEKCSSSEIPKTAWLLDLEDIEKDTSRLIRKKRFLDKPSKSTKAFFQSGDILYGKLRPYLNKVIVADEDGYCTTEILPLRPYSVIIPEYVKYFLKRRSFINYANSKTYGMNLPRLGTEDARQALFPLPPTQEQQRIVKKVDELMALCDRAQASKENRNELQQQLRQSAIHALETAETEEEFNKSWHFVRDNFSAITESPNIVVSLKKLLYNLAVHGRLTRQNQEETPVEIPNYNEIEVPYKIPFNWRWTQLHNIVELKSGSTFDQELLNVNGELPYLKVKDLSIPGNDSEIKFSSQYVTRDLSITKKIIPPNSIVFPKRGGAIATNKKRLVFQEILADTNIMALVCNNQPNLNLNYLYLWFSTIALEFLNTGTSVPQINNKDIGPLLVPVPPIEEQKRIVAKVAKLMKICDRVEENLSKKEELASAISASVIHHLEL